MILSIIVAVAENGVIGYQNKLPWHLPADTNYFRNKIKNKAVIMGRKSYESPNAELSQKKNVIITRQKNLHLSPNTFLASSIIEAVEMLQDEEEVFILGGQSIYKQSLSIIHKLYYTRVYGNFEGDAFFPAIDWQQWHLESKETFEADAEHSHKYSFEVYTRNDI